MGEYEPDAIRAMYNRVKAGAPSSWRVQLSGIQGDAAHTYGYHRARNRLPGGDYSRLIADDRKGDGDAASAVDITMSDAGMKAATRNLIKSAENPDDPRMTAVREFMGTLDGSNTVGRKHDGDYGWYTIKDWDDTHTWHTHISFLRRYANDTKKLADVADAMLGKPYEGEEVSGKEVWAEQAIPNPSWRADAKTNKEIKASSALFYALDEAHKARVKAESVEAKLDEVLKLLKAK